MFTKLLVILLSSYMPKMIFLKTFKWLIFNDLFSHFIKNELFTKCHLGYLPSDSCIPKLFSTVHKTNLLFDCVTSVHVRGILLEISKEFHKVWHPGLLYKLEPHGVKWKLLDLFSDHLHEWVQDEAYGVKGISLDILTIFRCKFRSIIKRPTFQLGPCLI